MSFALRPYQTEAVREICKGFDEGRNSLMLEMATGLGKTEIFVHLMSQWGEGRGLVICPMITLVAQAAKKINQRTGVMPGIEQGVNWSNESFWSRSPFVVASKQTLCKARTSGPRYERLNDVGFVVVDECHLSITEPYREMLEHYTSRGAKVLGVTATARRHDKLAMGNLYEHCVYQYGIVDAVPDGWLVNSLTQCVQLEHLDLSKVTDGYTQYGKDFNTKQLNAALEDEKTIFEIADVTARETRDLKTVVYCSSVKEARRVAERLEDSYKIRAGWICADRRQCSDERRHEVLQSFVEDAEGITHVCNVGILTTGWDFPGLQAIVQARPTKSLPLYTQIYGRGTRPLPGVVDVPDSDAEQRRAAIAASDKPHFLMIDLVDNALRHKIITSTDVIGGRLGFAVTERAKDILAEDGDKRSPDEVLLEAQRQLEKEREEAERRRMAMIAAEAKYSKRQVDPYSGQRASGRRYGRVARMPFGRFKGEPIAEIPTWYLEGCMRGRPEIKAHWLQRSIELELGKRSQPRRTDASIDEINRMLLEI